MKEPTWRRMRNQNGKHAPVGRGVLVWSPGNQCQYMAYWDGKKWKPWTPGAEELSNLTAWRALPPPPSESSDD